MGCELSVKYPELCVKDDAKFKNPLKKYCGSNNGNQESQMSNSNFRLLVSLVMKRVWMKDQLRAVLGIIRIAWNASCWEWPWPS